MTNIATKRFAITIERKVTYITTVYVDARSVEDAQDKFIADTAATLQGADWELDDEDHDVLEISEVD